MKHLWSGTWNTEELPENLKNRTKLIKFLQKDIRNENGKFFCEIYDDVFLHYRAGGNWRKEGLDLHKNLSQLLQNCLL
jgi:hypothetical protein